MEAIKYSAKGDKLGTVELPASLFNAETKNPDAVMYEVINMYLANQRQGTSKAKGRSDVKGSGAKIYRQKGTGHARMGNRRTNVRVGGGVAFGPLPKNWHKRIPLKKKRLALRLALTERAKNGQVVVIEDIKYDAPSTKSAVDLMNKINPDKVRSLVLIDGSDKAVVKSFANIEKVEMNRADSTFAYEILKCKCLVLTESALNKIEEVFVK
ncbi:MAG: 50S ribosomal protein L4 [Candidatus Cloacimonadota bacterium]|nr:MAG: 50S ribosomal protein L4 [Candidatus Cloacimonadota bacterium]